MTYFTSVKSMIFISVLKTCFHKHFDKTNCILHIFRLFRVFRCLIKTFRVMKIKVYKTYLL